MILYLDASAIVKLLVDEPGSAEALDLWASATRAASSRIGAVEARAALAAGRRASRLPQQLYRRATTALESRSRQMVQIDVSAPIASLASRLTDARGLRGCDAIHLASALVLGRDDVTFLTWDGAQARAALDEGLAVAGATL